MEGERVRVTFNGVTVDAMVVLGSENRKSLLLAWSIATALRTRSGGIYLGSMAVLFNDQRGRYEDLLEQDEVEITWLNP
jgi:hypothetical protein